MTEMDIYNNMIDANYGFSNLKFNNWYYKES